MSANAGCLGESYNDIAVFFVVFSRSTLSGLLSEDLFVKALVKI